MFCSLPTHVRARSATVGHRLALRRCAARAGVRRRCLPHQLRHAYVIELGREGVPLNVIQRELDHCKPRRDVDLPVPSSAASASRPSTPDSQR
jgi:integrase